MRSARRMFSWGVVLTALLLLPAYTAAQQPILHGAMIRQTKVEGYSLHYHLLTWKERGLVMKGMEGMEMPGVDRTGKATHHLLVYAGGSDGKGVPSAKVGFQLTAPDGSVQTTLTMAMSGGFGADVTLGLKGEYRITMKMEIGTRVVNDEFVYAFK